MLMIDKVMLNDAPGVRHPLKFYVKDVNTFSYAEDVPPAEAREPWLKVLLYVNGAYVGFKDYDCQNWEEVGHKREKLGGFSLALAKWKLGDGPLYMP